MQINNPNQKSNMTTTYIFIVVSILMAAIVGLCTYFIITYTNKSNNHGYEAVVINKDTDFNQTVEYEAQIVPGGTCEQNIEVSSILVEKVTYSFSFTTDTQNDFSMLAVNIKIGEEQVENKSLADVLNEKKEYQSTLNSNEKTNIKIVYTLDFNYHGNIDSWDFKINFNAKGTLMP